MSDIAVNQKLTVGGTIKDGIVIGSKNIGAILVNVLLWILTLWIPYINAGTTIGLWVGIVSKASRGEIIPMTEIFDRKYRKYIGEFFLTVGLLILGIGVSLVFFVIPGYVIAIAWSLAPLLAVDKGKNPSEAITASNNCTHGYKGKMFLIYLLVCLAFAIVSFVLSLIPGIGFVLVVVAAVFMLFVIIGLQASIYRQLTEGI